MDRSSPPVPHIVHSQPKTILFQKSNTTLYENLSVRTRNNLTTVLPLESFRPCGRQKHIVFTIRNALGHVWGNFLGHLEKTSKIRKTKFCVRRLLICSVLGRFWLNSKSDIDFVWRLGHVFACLF